MRRSLRSILSVVALALTRLRRRLRRPMRHASRSRRSSATGSVASFDPRRGNRRAAQRGPRGRQQLGHRPRPVPRPDAIYELLYSTQSTGIDSSDPALGNIDVDTEYYQFGGTLFFADEQLVMPYLSLTIGATRFSADGGYDSETQVLGQPRRRLAAAVQRQLRGDARRARLPDVRRFRHRLPLHQRREGADCLLRSSGSTYFQAEAQLGVTVAF